MSLHQLYNAYIASGGICTDTRREVSDRIFFALRGDNFDGNKYVGDALQKGCRLAVTDRSDLAAGTRVVYVPSVLETLQQLAHHHRMQVLPRVIAITGSNGKTTTKELVSAVLSTKRSICATQGNLNNHIGVPLTLLSLREEEICVVEMGANHPGEIALLAQIAAPELGLITNVGKAHLEGFGSIEGVLDAKGELYQYLASHEGKAIIDGEDTMLMEKATATGVQQLVVGPEGTLPVDARITGQSPFLEVELDVAGEHHFCRTKMVGSYNLQNIRMAAGVGFYFGIPAASIADAISFYTPENQRSQLIDGKRNRLILDAYNANPSSMREAINGLLSHAKGPTMLILGDMAELGHSSAEEHRSLVRWIGTLEVDRVLLAGPNFYNVREPSARTDVFRGRAELAQYLEQEKPAGFLILIKGSRVMELEKLLPLL